jgi:hypothetical protein
MRVLGWGRHQVGEGRVQCRLHSIARSVVCRSYRLTSVCSKWRVDRSTPSPEVARPQVVAGGPLPHRLRFSQNFLGELSTEVTSTRIVANVLTTATPLAGARADFETSANTPTQSMGTAPECAGRNGPKGVRVTPVVTLDRAPRSVNSDSRDGPHATPRHRASRPT